MAGLTVWDSSSSSIEGLTIFGFPFELMGLLSHPLCRKRFYALGVMGFNSKI